MIKRPFLLLLAGLCLGIICSNHVRIVMATVLLAYILLLFFIKYKPGIERILFKKSICLVFVPIFILIGAALGSYHSREYDVDLTLFQENGKKASAYVSGIVESVTAGKTSDKVVLKNIELRMEGEIFTQGKLLVYIDDTDSIKIGNTIEVLGDVREFMTAENPGQYDEKAYYRAKNMTCRMYAENFAVTDEKTDWLKELARRFRESLASVYDQLFPEDEAGVIKAVILGDKSTLTEDTKELYKNNGIGHILAISGLHISLIGGALFALLRRLKWPMFPAVLTTVSLILGYGLLTDFSISTIRAVFMLIFGLLAKLLGKSHDSAEAAAICGLGILLIQPLWLFQTGFQLSFAASIGIALFRIEFNKWKAGEGFGIKAKAAKALLSGISPQLVTTPIILSAYYEIPTFSLLMNLLLLPCMGLLVALGIVSGLIGLWSLQVAGFFAGGAYYLLKIYRKVCELVSSVPGSMLLFGNPGRIRLILCYSLIFAFFVLAGYFGSRHRFDRKGGIYRRRAAWLLVIVPFIFIKLPFSSLGLTSLSVGQGDCAVLQTTNNTAIMIDCGSSSVSNLFKYRLEPFLKYSGIDTLEAIFISHPDKDHISGIEELLAEVDNKLHYSGTVRVKRIITTPAALSSGRLDNIISLAAEKGIEIETVLEGDVIKYNELSLTCLSPSVATDTADNNGSLILLAGYYDFDAIFMGDSASPGEAAVLAARRAGLINEPLELLKVAHHGSKNASSTAFLAEVKPQIAVLYYGRGNSYGHPHARVLSDLSDLASVIYKTGQSGAACFKIQKNYK